MKLLITPVLLALSFPIMTDASELDQGSFNNPPGLNEPVSPGDTNIVPEDLNEAQAASGSPTPLPNNTTLGDTLLEDNLLPVPVILAPAAVQNRRF